MLKINWNIKLLLAAGGLLITVSVASAQIPYNTFPDWSSSESTDYGTGCDLADINGDGWLDLAVSNGNDMAMAPNYVYTNNLGMLPTSASWSSENNNFSGHCELADIDDDGHPELMVTNYISPGWEPGSIHIYDNIDGVLEATPSWETAEPVYSFRATFGDPDGDGDLDLAVATGESYHAEYSPSLIFFNEDGIISTTPGWSSADSDAAYDIQFVDIDNDGDQDLAVLTSQGPVKIYFNEGGSISTEPGWQTAANDNGNTFDFADLNGDGWLDLGVANNTQQGGSGYFHIFFSQGGVLPTQPDWSSASDGYGSAAIFADLDADGDQDLVTGRWWGPVSVYLNQNGTFPPNPDWQSAESPVVENIVFGDLDQGWERQLQAEFVGDGSTKLFHTGYRHLQGIDRVVVGGVDLTLSEYCSDTQAGWVSLAAAPTGPVTIHYRNSRTKDMVVSDWGGATIMFTHDGTTAVPESAPLVSASIQSRAYPNPFNPRLNIEYTLPRAAMVQLNVLDLRGRRVAQLVQGYQDAGLHSAVWAPRGLPSGEYMYRLEAEVLSFTGKVHLVK